MAILPRPALDRRFLGAAFSAAIHAAVLALLLLWHFPPSEGGDKAAMTVVDLPDRAPPEKPPPPPSPQPTPGAAKSDDAAPPAPRAEAAPLAKAVVPLVIPSFTPAPIPATGNQPASGAALAGTGTGAGGAGDGTGGGGNGGGGGDARSRREGTEPEVIRGSFRQSDYPKELREQGPRGTTWADVVVGANGRVTSCRISRPSGIPQFDAKTCQILLQRFRYRPARDAAGNAVAAPDSFSVDWDYVDLNQE
jgi:periplasmic protein TonB